MEIDCYTIRHSATAHVESGYHLVRRVVVKRRKSKVPAPPTDCPLSQCMRLLAGAWTGHVIWYLRDGERCFSELQTDIAGVSAKMLTNCLRKLERDGVIQRLTKPTSPPTVWYSLTPAGQELCLALVNLIDVAQRLRRTGATSL